MKFFSEAVDEYKSWLIDAQMYFKPVSSFINILSYSQRRFPDGPAVNNPPANVNPWVRKIRWRRKWLLPLVFLPGKSHGQRSLASYSPRGHKRVGHDLFCPTTITTTITSPKGY